MYVYVNTNQAVEFEWDEAKAKANLAKHGVSFELATLIWNDPLHVVVPDRIEQGEQRWHAIGVVGPVVVLVAVHSYPADDGCVRIIGARKATNQERRRYERENP